VRHLHHGAGGAGGAVGGAVKTQGIMSPISFC